MEQTGEQMLSGLVRALHPNVICRVHGSPGRAGDTENHSGRKVASTEKGSRRGVGHGGRGSGVAGCKGLLCYVDYIDTLTCKYAKDEDGTNNQITLYSMNVVCTGITSGRSFSMEMKMLLGPRGQTANKTVTTILGRTFEELNNETSELIPSGGKNEYTCKINMEDFIFDTKCTVFINGSNTLQKTCGPFIIGINFKPQAPFNLTVSLSENYNISWRTLYDMDIYRSNELAYELSYKKDAESWLNQKTIQLYEDEKSLVLLGSLFKAEEMYVARVRARPKNTSMCDFNSTKYSELFWIVYQEALVIQNLWKPWVLIPNPALFFKPLYMVHHGDFKSWLGSSYYQATPFDSMVFPEFFEVYSQGFLKNASKQDLVSLDKQKLLVTKPCRSGGIGDCRKCDCNGPVLDKDSESLPLGPQPCAHFNIRDDLEAAMDTSGDDSYPCVNLDSNNSNMVNHMLDCKSDSQATMCSLIHSNLHLKEGFLGPNLNILDLVPTSPEGWEFQDSPSQECDENVFYNDNYNAISPDSGNSADFGYPRICLDLDTIDSGFCDSECGSPVDSDFGNKGTPQEPLSSDSYNGEEELYERNYVKQWVPSPSVLAESTTKNLTE
ncbi:PREDICTED: interleukin-21 receptor [Nanorana parkeri]|uniref:interleukin-21 receptor n=1 Tax=Nanorana parkeri TaxID=125878 RepID=UPI000854C091|nr:PREDICTED: interleukin-21 receptor [Nanorana parkeri]